MRKELKTCPFCGSAPSVDQYPTLIRIYCQRCEGNFFKVEAFGDGLYSAWIRTQKADEKGMVELSAERNPVSDPQAYNRVADRWNSRVQEQPK